VELYVDTGEKEENERIFDALHLKKQDVEQIFGAPLLWERLDTKRACRVRFLLSGGLQDENAWPKVQESMISAMDRLSKAIKPYLARA